LKTLLERAQKLEAEGIFLGGPIKFFEDAGKKTLDTLLNEGLTPDSKVLDIGCGCLRIGYWLIHFLGKGSYYGIEPNTDMLNAGIRILLDSDLVDIKQPKFDYNNDFDFTVFKEKFDYFMARSIWTHASKLQIQTMLDGFVNTANMGAEFITSYIKPTLFKRDYKNKNWVGKSHESDASGTVAHSLKWIQEECSKRSLVAEEILEKAYNFGNQTWIRIKHKTI
tara:strand:- start:228 stop:896 length:669 start_codon:yes stop_codon:yes gene_type:complete